MWISIQRRVAPPAGHVGVLRVFAELRADGRTAQEEHVEPQVLGPAQVGHDARHRHQGRSREHGPVGIRFGQPFALQVHDRALQVEPANKLGPLVSHERRTLPRRGHGR
jgi:hypothetical protein